MTDLSITEKSCRICKLTKPLTAFYRDKQGSWGRNNRCKQCTDMYNKKYQQKRDRTRRLKQYGLTIDGYAALYQSQQGKCFLCGTWFSKLAIDHCHATGQRRKLLCLKCNAGLGAWRDSPTLIANAIIYLQTPRQILLPLTVANLFRNATHQKCEKCGILQLLECFTKNKRMPNGISSLCKQCYKQYRSTWIQPTRQKTIPTSAHQSANNKSRVRPNGVYTRRHKLQSRFGLSLEQYNQMLESQQHKCAICDVPAKDTPRGVLYVDHCHLSKANRGLLCGMCNSGLGYFADNIPLMESAIAYLQMFG